MTVIEQIDDQVRDFVAQRKMPRLVKLGTAAWAEYQAARAAALAPPPLPPPGTPMAGPPRVYMGIRVVPAFLDVTLAPDAVVLEE